MAETDKTATEKSTRLGSPGKPAGDSEAILQRGQEDRASARRRKKLIEEATRDSDVPRDELGEDAITKTVDDLIE